MAVPLPTPDPEPPVQGACRAFTDALPERLETLGDRRTTDPTSPLTAAYGDPPVSVRCGVPRPAALSATSDLVEVDGVAWFPEELTDGWLMTTVDRVANVEITVPADQGPAPSVAADLSSTILVTLPPS